MILREGAQIFKGEKVTHHVLIKRKYLLKEGMLEMGGVTADFTLEIKNIEQGHDWVSFKGDKAKVFVLDASFKGNVALEYVRADNAVIIKEEEIVEEEYIGVPFYPHKEKIGCHVVNTFLHPISYYELYICIHLLVTLK